MRLMTWRALYISPLSRVTAGYLCEAVWNLAVIGPERLIPINGRD
jgi:hypothetical protein